MRFALTDEQADFARSIDNLLTTGGTSHVIRTWAAGDHTAGLHLWDRLAELGVTVVADPDSGASTSDLVVAFEQLGRHAVPGPYVEHALATKVLGRSLDNITTMAVPRALDADAADIVYAVVDDQLCTAEVGELEKSIDPARRLFTVKNVVPIQPVTNAGEAHDLATLAVAAQLVGAGYHVLETAVDYAKSRVQFGKPIGQQQAVKHLLADARVALDFARPLVWGAALDASPRAVSAAKVAAGEAAYIAARAALQVHGATGYTEEYDLSLWFLKIRALRGAFGSPSYHRGRVIASVL